MKTVKVKFDNGKEYKYNTDLDLKVGDKVYVEGKMANEIGTVSNANAGYDNSDYMKMVLKKAELKPTLTFKLHESGKYYVVTDIKNITADKYVIPGTYKGLPVKCVGYYRNKKTVCWDNLNIKELVILISLRIIN